MTHTMQTMLMELVETLHEEIDCTPAELINADEAYIIIETATYGRIDRLYVNPGMSNVRTRHEGLGNAFDHIARHRFLSGKGHASPRATDMGISRATRLILGDRLQQVVDAGWPEYLKGDMNGRSRTLMWRTRGPVPSRLSLNRERQTDVIEIETPEDLPWMSGIIGLERFEVMTLADRGRHHMVRLGKALAQLRMTSIPETVAAALSGRRLADVVGLAAFADMDVTLAQRMRGEATIVHRLVGADIIPGDLPPALDVAALGDALAARCPDSIAIARRIGAHADELGGRG